LKKARQRNENRVADASDFDSIEHGGLRIREPRC
jgi:hypothetical protein